MSDSAPALPVLGEAVGPFDGDHPPPLDFEVWSDISATLMRRAPDEALDILNDREVDIELWDACNLFWLDELASQLRRGNGKLATRYGRRCAKELQSRSTVVPERSDGAEIDPEETAFMTALHDEMVLPFEPSLVEQPIDARPESAPDEHIDAGETQQVSTLTNQDLPFTKSE